MVLLPPMTLDYPMQFQLKSSSIPMRGANRSSSKTSLSTSKNRPRQIVLGRTTGAMPLLSQAKLDAITQACQEYIGGAFMEQLTAHFRDTLERA